MQRQILKGERRKNVITNNPSTAKMGEKLYLTVPPLDNNLSIIPGTMNLIYNIKNSNNKSWVKNNIGRLLVAGISVKLGKDIIYNNTAENVYRIYQDLWKSKQERDSMVGFGISSTEFRKSLCGSDDASSSCVTNGIKDSEMAVLMKNQRIPLGLVTNDHGLHSSRGLGFDIKYEITLPATSAEIGDHQSSQAVGDLTLENIQLEYDTLSNPSLVESMRDSMISGRSYIVEHLSLESFDKWDKALTTVNSNLHISRESLKTLIFLFKYEDQGVDETFINPGISEVTVTVNGKPNAIHTSSMKTDTMEQEARRFFESGEKEISSGQFFANTFSVVIDFRSLADKMKYNDGISLKGNYGVQTSFKRKATSKNVKVWTFVVADSIVNLDSTGFQKTIL